jgi:hypothetical protein
MKNEQLKRLLSSLERHCQRATYGAVGGVVGLPARSVMSGQPKTPRNSWVVAAKNGRPTGYSPSETHASLLSNGKVITSSKRACCMVEGASVK